MTFKLFGVLLLAAALEVSGDATMRQFVRDKALWFIPPGSLFIIAVGFALLSTYGWFVNHAPWDFSTLLGIYVVVFAWTGVLWGRFAYGDRVPASTWVGLAIITFGGVVIQKGAGPIMVVPPR